MKKKLSHQIAIVIMKISIIPVLLLMLAMCSYANDSAGQLFLEKKITIRAEQVEIKNVFSEIENITKARFVYSPELIDASRKVSINVHKKELSKVLIKLLQPLHIGYEVINNYIILRKEEIIPAGMPQDETLAGDNEIAFIRITGKIKSFAGAPLEGVSIIVKN